MQQVAISWSDDGGQTYSAPRYVNIGSTGQYSQVVRAWRLGHGRNRVFRVVYTGCQNLSLFGAQLELIVTDT
jgi:hypothetical protein